jgi:hypothetical protein
MAIKKIKISELPTAQSLVGLWTIGIDALNNSVKVGLQFLKTVADSATQAAAIANAAATEANNAATEANNAAERAEQITDTALQGASARFSAIVEFGTIQQQTSIQPGGIIVYVKPSKRFAYRASNGVLYADWRVDGIPPPELYVTPNGLPENKIYILDEDLYIPDETHGLVKFSSGYGIADAPEDGQIYGRQDGQWTEAGTGFKIIEPDDDIDTLVTPGGYIRKRRQGMQTVHHSILLVSKSVSLGQLASATQTQLDANGIMQRTGHPADDAIEWDEWTPIQSGDGSGSVDISGLIPKSWIEQVTGGSTEKVMSQKAVTDVVVAVGEGFHDVGNVHIYDLDDFTDTGAYTAKLNHFPEADSMSFAFIFVTSDVNTGNIIQTIFCGYGTYQREGYDYGGGISWTQWRPSGLSIPSAEAYMDAQLSDIEAIIKPGIYNVFAEIPFLTQYGLVHLFVSAGDGLQRAQTLICHSGIFRRTGEFNGNSGYWDLWSSVIEGGEQDSVMPIETF